MKYSEKLVVVAVALVFSVVDAAQTQKNLHIKNHSGQKDRDILARRSRRDGIANSFYGQWANLIFE